MKELEMDEGYFETEHFHDEFRVVISRLSVDRGTAGSMRDRLLEALQDRFIPIEKVELVGSTRVGVVKVHDGRSNNKKGKTA